jgi:hypothetical protein
MFLQFSHFGCYLVRFFGVVGKGFQEADRFLVFKLLAQFQDLCYSGIISLFLFCQCLLLVRLCGEQVIGLVLLVIVVIGCGGGSGLGFDLVLFVLLGLCQFTCLFQALLIGIHIGEQPCGFFYRGSDRPEKLLVQFGRIAL